LLLLDGHSVAYRAFYALPVENFSTTTGQATNAVYGFTSMLINALRDEKPTHIGVAFDVSRQTFRAETFPEYKGNRAASPSEFNGQVDFIADVLDSMDVAHTKLDGFEADDIIATWATHAEAQGAEVLIVSGDRDVLQLVTDKITMLYPRKGVSDMARMTPAAVQAKYNVSPQMYPDLAAIVGETSDNLPGVPGVGPGYASKWLNQFGSLNEVIDRADEIPGKKGDALRENLSQVMMNRQINRLITDLDLPLSIDELQRTLIDRQKVHTVFDALQFRVLRERLFDTLEADVAVADEQYTAPVETIAPGSLSSWLGALAGEGPIGVGIAGTWGAGTGDLSSVSFANEESVGWIDLRTALPADDQALADWLGNPRIQKAIHDAKGPMLALRARGWRLDGLTIDTALAAYLALPGQRTFDLQDLAARFLNRDLTPPTADQEQLSFDVAENSAAEQMGRTAQAVRDLAEVLQQYLAERGGDELLVDVEQPLEFVLADMEATGIAVDVAQLEKLESQFGDRVRDAETQAHLIAGRQFNLGSPKQLQEVLFVERGLPKTKKIKTGYTTDADALQTLFAKTADPLLEWLLRWRDVSRLRQTVAGLIPLADAQSRIHTTFNQIVAATGRLSSQEPNLQNIPIRTDEGRRIRAAFVVGQGYESLLTADYSQIEMRIMAHLSQDDGLIEAFRSGEDLHNTVASKVFDRPVDQINPELRRKIKAMSYGLAYGLSPYGLGIQLAIPPEEAKALMNDYFDRFGGIRDYLQEVVVQARATGYTETIMGRRRYLPDLTSDNRQRREMAERMALNAPIQGSAADIIKVAMLSVDRGLREEGLQSRMLLQVHDELVVEVAPGEREQVTDLVRQRMMGAVLLSVPMDVSTGTGVNWELAAH